MMDWLDEALADRRDRSLMRQLRVRPVERARDFSSNDYLALRHDPRLHLAGIEAAARYGSGAGSSPAVSGWTTAHETLAKEMAGWKEAECFCRPNEQVKTRFCDSIGRLLHPDS